MTCGYTTAVPSPRGHWRWVESLPAIGKLLGHSQAETTARYAHLAQDSVREAAVRISDSIAAFRRYHPAEWGGGKKLGRVVGNSGA